MTSRRFQRRIRALTIVGRRADVAIFAALRGVGPGVHKRIARDLDERPSVVLRDLAAILLRGGAQDLQVALDRQRADSDDGAFYPKTSTFTPLAGSLQVRWVTCGKEPCRCLYGDLHGPYYVHVWRENGRTRKRSVRQQDAFAV